MGPRQFAVFAEHEYARVAPESFILYTVTLTVFDAEGDSQTASTLIGLTGPMEEPPPAPPAPPAYPHATLTVPSLTVQEGEVFSGEFATLVLDAEGGFAGSGPAFPTV